MICWWCKTQQQEPISQLTVISSDGVGHADVCNECRGKCLVNPDAAVLELRNK